MLRPRDLLGEEGDGNAIVLPSATVVAERLCFHRCLSTGRGVYTPGAAGLHQSTCQRWRDTRKVSVKEFAGECLIDRAAAGSHTPRGKHPLGRQSPEHTPLGKHPSGNTSPSAADSMHPTALADPRGPQGCAPPGSKFFHFHAVFGK